MSGRSRLVPFEHPFFRRQHSWHLDDPWSDLVSPSRLMDQHFGMGLSDDEFFRSPSLLRSRQYRDLMPTTSASLDDDFYRSPSLMRSRQHRDLMTAASAPLEDDFYQGMYLRPRRQDSTHPSGLSEVSCHEYNFIY